MNRRSICFALFAAGSLMAATAVPAEAHGPRVGVSISINVPAHIPVYRVAAYRPYYMGQAWFRPHHHVHVVYAFPVHGVYVPHVYCGGVLVRTGYVPGYDPRYDDVAAGYGGMVWDGALSPYDVGIDLRYAPRWGVPRSPVVYERRYGEASPYIHGRHARDRRREHRHDRSCDHD